MRLFFACCLLLATLPSSSQQKTYCNPINIDYGFTPIPNFSEQGRHRATADPVILTHKANYYLFSTNQWDFNTNGPELRTTPVKVD